MGGVRTWKGRELGGRADLEGTGQRMDHILMELGENAAVAWYYSMAVGRIRSPAFLKWDSALSRSVKSLSVNKIVV